MSKKTEKKRKCPECKGTGDVALLISRVKCENCDGTGFVTQDPPSKKKVASTGSQAMYDMSGRNLSAAEETMDDPDYQLEFDDFEEEPLWYEALD